MNQYGTLAWSHWEKFRPRELSQMSDPPRFFTNLGQQIEQRIVELEESLEQAYPAQEDYEARIGQLNQIRADAKDQALRETLPEAEDEQETEEIDPRMARLEELWEEHDQL